MFRRNHLPDVITLGGWLCTMQEAETEDLMNMLKLKRDLQTQLKATVKGLGTRVLILKEGGL